MEKIRAVYIPGLVDRELPLSRFLPPLPGGAVRAWLENTVPAAALLLDPLGSTPALPLEIARTGRRVLVASNNPILSFMIETLASAPKPEEFNAALAELFSTRRGAERLETHLESLYATTCPGCQKTIQAAGYVWRKGESEPALRLIRCPACQTEGEFPLQPADQAILAALTGSDQLHRSRALGRIFLGDEGDPAIAEEAVNSYLPRPLYVLTTLINRVTGLPASPQRKRLLTALLLSLLDQGSALWSYPFARSRPRQITIPQQFRENNLWLGLENAIADWCTPGPPVAVTRWPELPPENGGICLYSGRLRSLLPLPEGMVPAATAVVLPRPNSAFWTFSATWAGWVWGREAAQPLKVAFERRRYDWHWHTAALFSTFSALNQHFAPGLRLFAHLPELAPGFLSAALAASHAAGLALDGIAVRGENDPAQVHWRTARDKPRKTITTAETLLRQGIRAHLLETGEPAPHLTLYAAGLQIVALEGGMPQPGAQVNTQILDTISAAASKTFADRKFLHHLGGGTTEESGQYWLQRPEQENLPLPERLESYLRDQLSLNARQEWSALETAANRVFRGLQTPSLGLLRAMVDALAEPDPTGGGMWRLRDGETAAAHAQWTAGTGALLERLAAAMGMRAAGAKPLLMQTAGGEPLFALYLVPDGAISAVLLGETPLSRAQCVLVFPDHRAGLVQMRLQRDPRLLAVIVDGWRMLRSGDLQRYISEQGSPDLASFEALLDSDAPSWRDATQMQMF